MSIKRQDIVNLVKTRFQAILVSGGYHSNVGQHVFVWRRAPVEAADLPALLIFDTENNPAWEGLQGSTSKLDYMLKFEVYLMATGSAIDTTIRQLIADVYKAIGVDPQWGGSAGLTELEGDEILLDHEGEIMADARVKFSIRYRTSKYQES